MHQPRVLERHAQAAGQSRQQAKVVLGERVCPIEVLEGDATADLISGDQWSNEHRACGLSLDNLLRHTAVREPGVQVAYNERRLRLEELAARGRVSSDRLRLVGEAHAPLDRIRIA